MSRSVSGTIVRFTFLSFLVFAGGRTPGQDVGPSAIVLFDVGEDGVPVQRGSFPTGVTGFVEDDEQDIAIDPGRRLLFATNWVSSGISAFSIAADGSLMPVSGSPFTIGAQSSGLALQADLGVLYATTYWSLLTFAIGPDGSLTEIQSLPRNHWGIAIHPSGRYLYASGQFSSGGYEIAADGTLTPLPAMPDFQSFVWKKMKVSSDGRRLYAIGEARGKYGMLAFDIDSSGGLTLVAGTPVPTGGSDYSLEIGGDDRYGYLGSEADQTIVGFDLTSGPSPAPLAGSPFHLPIASTMLVAPRSSSFLYSIARYERSIQALSISDAGGLSAIEGPVAVTDPLRRMPNGAAFLPDRAPGLSGRLYCTVSPFLVDLFRRGDIDGSGAVDIGDLVAFAGLFGNPSIALPCEIACNVGGYGLRLGSMLHLYSWLFIGDMPEPNPPGPFVCGPSPYGSEYDLTCESYDCSADGSHPATDEFELGFTAAGTAGAGPGRTVLCTITHSGDGPGALGFSFGVSAEGGKITAVTEEGTSSAAGASLKTMVLTEGAGNEGALCAVVFEDFSSWTLTPLPTNATSSVARLTVEPLPGSETVTLHYMEGLQAADMGDQLGQPVKVLVSRIRDGASETLVPRTTSMTIDICPITGDTHCLGLQMAGPDSGGPGTYTATATAKDDSDDSIIYTFTAKRGDEPPLVAGPQAAATAAFDLGAGDWTISVAVDDSVDCAEAAADSQCSTTVRVSVSGGLQVPGDANGDKGIDISDPVSLLGLLFLGASKALPCGDGTSADPGNISLIDWQPDGAIDISDAVSMLSFLFLGGRPHTLAVPGAASTGCIRIPGCPDGCP
jgi:hypothetical protein